jgi:4-alpha-glucanotransferase
LLAGRSYGVLLPVFSLPSPYGVGDFGPKAREFVTLLGRAGSCCWQILPLVPTSPDRGNSPYSSESSFALNYIFISPEDLAALGLISSDVTSMLRVEPSRRVDYNRVYTLKRRLVEKAFKAYMEGKSISRSDLELFLAENEYWLRDYALYRILRALYGAPWSRWPQEYKKRKSSALEKIIEEHKIEYEYVVFEQWQTFPNRTGPETEPDTGMWMASAAAVIVKP